MSTSTLNPPAAPTAAQAIEALIQRWADAVRRSNLDAIMSCYTPDIVSFDAIMALQFTGAEAYRRHWADCFTYLNGGSMLFEIHQLHIAASDNAGFAHYLSRCGYIDSAGHETTSWMRGTTGFRRRPEGWRIAHEHFSMPIDPANNQALINLSPEPEPS